MIIDFKDILRVYHLQEHWLNYYDFLDTSPDFDAKSSWKSSLSKWMFVAGVVLFSALTVIPKVAGSSPVFFLRIKNNKAGDDYLSASNG